jgi:hypothetical protein
MNNLILDGKLQEFKEFHNLNEKDTDSFEKFVNYALLSSEYYDSFEFDKVSTGTAQGIDGLAISINDLIINSLDEAVKLCEGKITVRFILIQSKTSDSFSAGDFSKFINEAVQFFQKNNKDRVSEELHKYYEIKEYIMHSAKRMDKLPEIVLRYVFSGKVSESINQQMSKATAWFDEQEYIYSDFDCKILGGDEILTFYKQAKNDFEKNFIFEKKISLPKMSGAISAYLGILKCSDFIKLISNKDDKINKSLFVDNVRDFLGLNGTINSNIDNTLKDLNEKDKFAILNNGITIVAKKIILKGSDEVILKNFQIVNGCQTSHILFKNKDLITDSMYITLKLIETDDIDLSNKIIETTNSQSEVKKEALVSIHPYHKKIEEYFNIMRKISDEYLYFYERRPHQFDDNHHIKKSQIVSIPQLIKSFVSIMLSEPHKVHYYYGSLVSEYMISGNSKLFNDKDNPGVYFVAHHIFSLCNKKTYDKKYKKWLYHIAYLVKKFLLPKEVCSFSLTDDKIKDILSKINENFDEAYNNAIYAIKSSGLLNNESAIRQENTVEKIVNIFQSRKPCISEMKDGKYYFKIIKINQDKVLLQYGEVKCTLPFKNNLKGEEKVLIEIKDGKPNFVY